MYDPVINDGDRVALAPHLDLWMAGIRFGVVESHSTHVENGRIRHIFYVETDDGRVHAFNSDDLLGAVRPSPTDEESKLALERYTEGFDLGQRHASRGLPCSLPFGKHVDYVRGYRAGYDS